MLRDRYLVLSHRPYRTVDWIDDLWLVPIRAEAYVDLYTFPRPGPALLEEIDQDERVFQGYDPSTLALEAIWPLDDDAIRRRWIALPILSPTMTPAVVRDLFWQTAVRQGFATDRRVFVTVVRFEPTSYAARGDSTSSLLTIGFLPDELAPGDLTEAFQEVWTMSLVEVATLRDAPRANLALAELDLDLAPEGSHPTPFEEQILWFFHGDQILAVNGPRAHLKIPWTEAITTWHDFADRLFHKLNRPDLPPLVRRVLPEGVIWPEGWQGQRF